MLDSVAPGAAAVVAAVASDNVLHRRIEFHPARKSFSAISNGGGGFRLETLNPEAAAASSSGGAAPAVGEGRRSEKGEIVKLGRGVVDPELSFSRMTFRRIGAGLENLGNTCYLNSVLQCLTYTEPFAAYLQSGKHKSSCRTAGFCALCALQNHVMNALQSSGKILKPNHLVKNLRCISRNFRNSRQEDAHELMVNLLESMHKCCLPSGVPSESPSAYERSLVHKIFGGRLRSQVRCTRCNYCSDKFDPFLDLSLEIVKATSLLKALQNFTEEELLDGGEKQYQCQHCRQKVVAKKKFTIDKAPYVLTIHLKRFSAYIPGQKIDKRVDFAPTLNLKPFVSDPQGMDLRYSLYGVLVHAGWNTHSGHYYCFVRTSSGMWHSLDDVKVCQVSEKTVLSQKAYMLFYVRDRGPIVKSPAVRKDNLAPDVLGKKMISQQVSCLNGVVQNGVLQRKLNGSSLLMHGDMKSHATINGQSTILSNASIDQSKFGFSSQNSSNMKAVGATGVQTNSPALLQKATHIHPDGGALSAKSVQITSEIPSSGDPDVICSDISNSSHKKLTEVPMQQSQPKADHVLTHPVKATSGSNGVYLNDGERHTSNGMATALESHDCTSQPKTYASPNYEDGISASRIVCSNGPSSFEGAKKDLAESSKQPDQAVCSKEFTTKDAHGGATEEYLNNSVPEAGEVGLEKQSCSYDSIQMKVPADSANGDAVEKMDSKSKKFVRYSVKNLYVGPKQLLLSALKLHKKKKFKKTKRQRRLCKDKTNAPYLDDITSDQQTSTSETVGSARGDHKSHKRKRSCSVANSDSNVQSLKKGQYHAGDSVDIGGLSSYKRDIKNDAEFASAVQPNLCSSLPAAQCNSRDSDAHEKGPRQREFMSLLTRGLTEITVARWDDVDLPNTELNELGHSRNSNIGYVLDEWDEEYDRGRRKKVRNKNQDFGGPNPFQETLNERARQGMKLNADQTRLGNQPLRI